MIKYGIRLTDTGCEVAGAPRWIPFALGWSLLILTPINLVIGDGGVENAFIAGLYSVMGVLAIRLSMLRVSIDESGVFVRNILKSRRIPWSSFRGFFRTVCSRPRRLSVRGYLRRKEHTDTARAHSHRSGLQAVIARLVDHLDSVVIRLRQGD